MFEWEENGTKTECTVVWSTGEECQFDVDYEDYGLRYVLFPLFSSSCFILYSLLVCIHFILISSLVYEVTTSFCNSNVTLLSDDSYEICEETNDVNTINETASCWVKGCDDEEFVWNRWVVDETKATKSGVGVFYGLAVVGLLCAFGSIWYHVRYEKVCDKCCK